MNFVQFARSLKKPFGISSNVMTAQSVQSSLSLPPTWSLTKLRYWSSYFFDILFNWSWLRFNGKWSIHGYWAPPVAFGCQTLPYQILGSYPLFWRCLHSRRLQCKSWSTLDNDSTLPCCKPRGRFGSIHRSFRWTHHPHLGLGLGKKLIGTRQFLDPVHLRGLTRGWLCVSGRQPGRPTYFRRSWWISFRYSHTDSGFHISFLHNIANFVQGSPLGCQRQ